MIQSTTLDFYRARPKYGAVLAEMDSLLARNFVLLEMFEAEGDGTLAVYRRKPSG